MWLMPSFGRPEALTRLLDAPGGWPRRVHVLVNEDDPDRLRYQQTLDRLVLDRGRENVSWRILPVPAGSRFADAVRHAYVSFPNERFYGIIDDDYWPVTPFWYERMTAAAGSSCVAIANNKVNFPKPYCCRVMGGDLARAIGTIAPGAMRHNFSDDAWGRFAEDFGVLRPLQDVIVEHRHHLFDAAVKKDATYDRGSGADFESDRKLYHEWLVSPERKGQCERVAALLGVTVTTTDYSKVRLALCVPIQNHSVDISFHHSFHRTTALLAEKRISYCVQEAAGGSHIGKAREQVLWGALRAMPDATHLMFIDDDMGWDPKLITRLICADHDFAAVAGVKKVDELSLCYNQVPGNPRHPVTKFLKVRHVGFAFVMLKRCVVERMCAAYPELEYNTDGHGRQWSLFFDLMWQQPQHMLPERLSEDFSFCERWNRIGGEIWIDPDAALIHAGRKEYTGKASDQFPAVVADAA